ncbi:hypothetical protein MTR_1g057670 [Medicago truncatula]|uniref:Uncharacterized protein n=1 Tax=Medicago truncatula TaxID=3880 RepID=A0A072VKJ2_MEDTR|nr:hypothetical protein MTR_1g057670 [Medicago truncatula]
MDICFNNNAVNINSQQIFRSCYPNANDFGSEVIPLAAKDFKVQVVSLSRDYSSDTSRFSKSYDMMEIHRKLHMFSPKLTKNDSFRDNLERFVSDPHSCKTL